MLGGGRVSTERPKGRTTAGAEIKLDTWEVFSSADLLNSLIVERMLGGVAIRSHQVVGEPSAKGPKHGEIDVEVGHLQALRVARLWAS